ncbi:uroporphyrinogen-III C-methyltransferase [Brucella inopinata]|uniref:uroporphyrinogen-III C-methyltransferase n=1 Tax=Brucella inopinata TaxID=1218315 RepID=A0AAW7B2D6_9HYPH|nr:uroporphyrinogen-III C-methyltransferase [Brucella inopinata]EFM57212.1 uroporphyrin-III C-methyltransferase [Brucella inopinata BO1]KEY05243.1 uroporphyrin-III methyltransferase [Brucella suis bv. 4 str. 40]MDL2332291.1 uroporphyrinogen-III C-methyltransferase [Brucella inopinata]
MSKADEAAACVIAKSKVALPVMEPGHVWLVGAGPGDPGLLTLHAVNALQQADVIVYDALVDDSCLSLKNATATLEYAGKRGGKPSPRQRDISLRLVELARQGKKVLRLKGGDPFVFGRGAEEALTLVEYHVPFRIVPGVTAGVGGLAYAGIAATHRDINQAVTFLTGHDATGAIPDGVDWAGIARSSPVIVMYMAMKHIGLIAGRLIEAGRSPDEPVAFVCNASLPDQTVLETTLGRAAIEVEAAGLQPPAIVVVGEVVRLRAGLDWIGAMAGKSLVSDPLGKRTQYQGVQSA